MTHEHVKIKICGLTDHAAIETANELQIDFAGFMFFPKSPRHLSYDKAAMLAARCAPQIERIAVLVDADDITLETVMATIEPHRLQLHGQETPQRIAEIKARWHRPVIKALSVSTRKDVTEKTAFYRDSADWYLFDTKPPQNMQNPGGNARAFDWDILTAYDRKKPWMLAGGLNAQNVQIALGEVRPPMLDISSGVESICGKKDSALMRDFVNAVAQVR